MLVYLVCGFQHNSATCLMEDFLNVDIAELSDKLKSHAFDYVLLDVV